MRRMFAGRMFVRKVSEGKNGKAILVAVIDCPDESDIQNESLHSFYGHEERDGRISLTTTHEVQDITELARGNSIDGIITSSIWSTWSKERRI